MKIEKLAILGGRKSINEAHPHWSWPVTSPEEIDAVTQFMKNGCENKNGYPVVVAEFESEFANYHNTKFALTSNSGTSSLHAAFFAVGICDGDEVIAPSLTFHATASPLKQLNAVPILCDCEPDTGNIDPKEIEKKITNRTKAIIVTHLCGHPCEMDEIMRISKKNNIPVIEDCSHAHGSMYKGKKVGTFGAIGVFSMNNYKMLSAGESGILITDKQELYERALLFSDFGPRLESGIKLKKHFRYRETGLGSKYRINPICAVIALEKLKKLDFYIESRKEKLDYLSQGLLDIPGLTPPVTREYVDRGAYYGYRPFIKKNELNNMDIMKFIDIMSAEGMEIRQSNNPPLHILPLFKKPVSVINNFELPNSNQYKKIGYYKKGDLPASEFFYDNTFSLPTFTFESKEFIDKYINAFNKVCNHLSNNKSF